MAFLIAGLAILISVHLIPSRPLLRQRLVESLGEMRYLGVFSLVSIAGLVLIVYGMGRAPMIPLWQPPSWGRSVTQVLMAPALLLLVAAYIPGNIKRFTPHPMSWAVVLWAIAHLPSVGDAASLWLFGALGGYALFAIGSGNRRGAQKSHRRMGLQWDLLAVVLGFVMYSLLLMNHDALFGVPVV